MDPAAGRVYALALNELGNLIVHLSLTEIATNFDSPHYLMYLREIMSCHLSVSDMGVALKLAQQVLTELNEGADIDNPIEVAFLLSADLHGQSAVGHNERAH
jgi:hypothetical protein